MLELRLYYTTIRRVTNRKPTGEAMEKVNLTPEGYPQIDLYEDGKIVNLETGKIYQRQRVIYAKGPDGEYHYVVVPILLRRYFMNELKKLPPNEVENLAFMGYPDYSVTMDGRLWTHKFERWMTLPVNQNGYIDVNLSKDGVTKSFKFHRIVAKAFVPNPYHYDQIDHIDGDKTNNAAYNLEWVDGIENARRARLNGLKPMAITEEGVEKACQLIVQGKSDSEIAKECGTYPEIIAHIRKGHTYCHISSKYGIEAHRIRGRKIDWSKYTKYQKNFKHYTPIKDQKPKCKLSTISEKMW